LAGEEAGKGTGAAVLTIPVDRRRGACLCTSFSDGLRPEPDIPLDHDHGSRPGDESVTATTDENGKVTTAQRDPLGRLTKVWANNRPTNQTPDLQYTYTQSNTGPNSVETQKLGPTGRRSPLQSVRRADAPTSDPTGHAGR
jgi:YD repeat-containing protein